MEDAIWGVFGLLALCLIGAVADGMWKNWLIYKATRDAISIIERELVVTPSPAELNTMDCQGGQ